MLRYKTKTRPGLVALYDIRPGNGAGQFLQPRSPHGAYAVRNTLKNAIYKMQSYSSAQKMRQILDACHLTA